MKHGHVSQLSTGQLTQEQVPVRSFLFSLINTVSRLCNERKSQLNVNWVRALANYGFQPLSGVKSDQYSKGAALLV